MITTITANPCIDKTIEVPHFDLYKMNRAKVLRNDVSGKGINVSLALNGLGAETICSGFDFCKPEDSAASPLKSCMASHGIPCQVVDVPGALRTCTKIFVQELHHTIEVNEYGPTIPPEAGEQLLKLVLQLAEKSDFITLSGSLPGGLEKDFYYRCARAIKEQTPRCRVVVDAETKLLLQALEAAPCFIKPNIHEFRDTFHCEVKTIEEIDAKVQELLARYSLEYICVSMGADGAYIGGRKEAWTCRPVSVEIRSIQGAGDAMVAGICLALQQGLKLDEVLRYGVTASGASIMLEGTQLCQKADFEELLKQDISLRKVR